MSKQKQETTNSNLVSKQSLALPTIVARRSDREASDDIEVSRGTVMDRQNRDEHLRAKLKKVKENVRQSQLAALSKVVDKAFTGWTIKTQKQE